MPNRFHQPPGYRPARGILTLATGSEKYKAMARDLGLSLEIHCRQILRAVVTDSAATRWAAPYSFVISHRPEFGDGFCQKLWLNEYTPFDETLFIDCDSLVVRDLGFMWDVFRNGDIGYVGRLRRDGFWYTDIRPLIERLGLPWLPILNTGMLYFKKTGSADRIFERARAVYQAYEELGFEGFRNTRSDEPCLSVALSEHRVEPTEDSGSTMRTPIGIEGPMRINVLAGICEFVKQGERVRPAIAHFATWQRHPIYERERLRVRLRCGLRIARPLCGVLANSVYLRRRLLRVCRGQWARVTSKLSWPRAH